MLHVFLLFLYKLFYCSLCLKVLFYVSKFVLNHVPQTHRISITFLFSFLGRAWEEVFSLFNSSGYSPISYMYHISIMKRILIFKNNTYSCGNEPKSLQFRNIMLVNESHSMKSKDSLQACLALCAAPDLLLTEPPGTRSPPRVASGCPTRNPKRQNYNTHNSYSSLKPEEEGGWLQFHPRKKK